MNSINEVYNGNVSYTQIILNCVLKNPNRTVSS